MPGKIHVPIAVNVQGMDKVTKAMGSLTRGVGRAVTAFGALAAAGTIKFGAEAIQGGRDLERNLEGLATVFGSTTGQMENFARNATGMGLSLSEAAKASTFIGSVIKQSGFEIDATADLTERLVTLGADLALTYGYDVQEALLGMTALFRGEYDPIEKFGVAMKQSEIDAVKLARGMGHLTGAAERFADQQIRVELLFERSKDAMGAVERQTTNLAVQQNKLNASFNNMRDIAGMELIPVIAEFMSQLSDILVRLTPKLIETFAKFEEPMRRISMVLLPAIESALSAFMDFLQDVAEIITLATDPTTELGNALQEARIAVDYLFKDFERFGLEVPSFIEAVTTVIKVLAETVTNVTYAIQDVFWFIEAFVGALGRVDIGKLMFGNETEMRRFQGYISSALYSKQRLRDITVEEINAQEDLNFQTDQYVQAQKRALDGYLDFLNRRALEAKTEDVTPGGEDPPKVEVEIDVVDPVKDFFASLQEEIEKQAASFQLKNLGLSDAIVESIIGSGEGWRAIFDEIMSRGADAADFITNQFMLTKAGLADYERQVQELYEELDRLAEIEEEIAQIQKDLAESIEDIKAEFKAFKEEISDLTGGIDALTEYQREIGRFESKSVSDLKNIEQALKGAFSNEMIFEEAKDRLTAYAREEMALLIKIQRDRDELLATRDAAAETIFGVAESVAASAGMLSLLNDVQEKTQEIEITEVMEGIVKSADKLKDFKTTLTRNFTEVVTETVDKAAALTNGFQSVIDKTRLFIDNLNTLRELGLDPFLFNQLVEAGAEAGGATAQALVDGGSKTVDEINKLQGELNDMGVELGELTYETMKGQGALFVSGIVDGLNEQLAALEVEAVSMANSFADAFESAFNKAIDAMELNQIQVAQAEAAQAIKEVQQEIKPAVDQATVNQLKALVEGAQRFGQNVQDATMKAGASIKGSIYQGLLNDALAGRAIDISGIQSGMSSAELAQAALAARGGGNTVVNNVTVRADSPLTAHEAGTQVVNHLLNFQTSSGNVTATLSGFGA